MAKETRTYRDRASYHIKYVKQRRTRLKEMAVKMKGGKCEICGYNKYLGALDFHHIDQSTKKFDLTVTELTKSWEVIKEEVEKCMLVCSNCHREIHGGI